MKKYVLLAAASSLLSNVAIAKSDLDYFPVSYSQSVQRFEAQASLISKKYKNVSAEAFPVPSTTDSDLQINSLFIPAQTTPRDLLVITSGVHGGEAFAGSAVQQLMMQEILPKMNLSQTGVLLIHAINPYGFKHFRRVSENNVDLNRNFPANDNLYTMKNEGYEVLRNILSPEGVVDDLFINRMTREYDILSGLVSGQYKVKQLGDSIGQGQHHHPQGLAFGGVKPEPNVHIVTALMKKISQPYQRVVILDVHTGLGSSYQLHMMSSDGISYKNSAFLRKLFRPKHDGNHYDLATGDDEGFYPTPGDIINALPVVLAADQPGKEVLAMTAEFGTLGDGPLNQLRTLNRMIVELQGFRYGYASPSIEESVKHDYRELFFPSDLTWRKVVLSKSRYVIGRVIQRLKE